ncbi:MAG: cobyrinate a,c-diamide synthase [Alphaproteobacteria bacterium]|nr:cobyrinate a,c-diamide synthase [Alphaproteobacteria bacterium]
MQGFVVAASQSGSGKTAITLALVRLLTQRNFNVVPAKVGPDYIDPQFLSLATARAEVKQHGQQECINLDPWAMRGESLDMLIAQASAKLGATAYDPLLVVEGVMGLFDGAADGSASTADLAVRLGLPIVLVVNAARYSTSIAALVQGFVRFRADVVIAGVILNQVGSTRHATMLREALARHCPDIAVFGAIPRNEVYAIPGRHLGLVQAQELVDHSAQQEHMAQHLEQYLDFDAVLDCAKPVQYMNNVASGLLSLSVQRLAVAQDAAFSFLYAGQLQAWQTAGHEINVFSPLADQAPAANAEGILLPGGYPEIYAAALTQAKVFRSGMLNAAARGVQIHGECGGYMALGDSLTDHAGTTFPMLGLLPGAFRLHHCRRTLGYRAVTLQREHLFGQCGAYLRGHEFHYGAETNTTINTEPLFETVDARGTPCPETGVYQGAISGSFVHLVDSC